MSQTLYRKYRPLTFDSVVGQQNIVTTLQNAIKSGRLSHAYMFCGPRGTGKTTMARILAKACLCGDPVSDNKTLPTANPCGECQECDDIANGVHPDVYELDAASRTGVENVREEIIGRVNFAPTRSKYKIYIIDEVHMLSIAAFNALLKTLEEPPVHVIFILCTTDPQKVPQTILSRCQRFNFRPISEDDIVSRLSFVCEQESVSFDEEALLTIAKEARGAMRNALTILEQMFSYCNGQITSVLVKQNLGSKNSLDFSDLLTAIADGNLKNAFEWVDNFAQNESDYESLVTGLFEYVKSEYIGVASAAKQSIFSADILHYMLILFGELRDNLGSSVDQKLSFEVCVAKIIRPNTQDSVDALAARVSKLESSGVTVSAAPNTTNLVSPEPVVATAPEAEDFVEPTPEPEPVDTPTTQADPVVAPIPDLSTTDSEPVVSSVSGTILNNSRPEVVYTCGPDSQPEVDEFTTQSDSKLNIDLTNENKLNEVWHKAFANIKKAYPAYGAFLITAIAQFNESTNQVILKFPQASKFAADTISVSETASKIADEISKVAGKKVGIDVEVDDINDAKFDPVPHLKPEQSQDTSTPTTSKNPLVSEDDMRDMLSSFGANNITQD